MRVDDPKSYADGGLPQVGSTMPDWSRVRRLTKNSPWPSKLGFWRCTNHPTLSKNLLITETGNAPYSPCTQGEGTDDVDIVNKLSFKFLLSNFSYGQC